ncbi:hypothetical protein SAMN04488055_5493 [Chitinophaga niabensis]|uniref:Uncharacterized protein n=1 Tax=Chitinophaga niabensis TaxID=536979 RepID=A0A1N6KC08_9BACT|nr:hypothetical protein SAMN04488055_5493 [Chitinophaga niabensis]
MLISTLKETFITVRPYHPIMEMIYHDKIKIECLCFWFDGECRHPINNQTLKIFLNHAEIFTPSVFPERPDLGCYAIDNDINYENGELQVGEIYYKGNLIYYRK